MLRQFRQSSLRGIVSHRVFIQKVPFALLKLSDVTIFIVRGSNPAGIPTRLSFLFQERIAIIYETAAPARFAIVLSDLVLVNFVNLDNPVPILHGQSYRVYDPRSRQGSLGMMPTFATGVLFCHACPT
jgi:hypothetical protein